MKKLILFLFIAVLPCAATFAQTEAATSSEKEIKLSPENEKKCKEMSRELANAIELNELEFIKLYALNKEKLCKEATALAALKNSPEAYKSKLQEIEADFENKLNEIMSPRQKSAYAVHKQSTSNAEMIVITTEE